MGILDTVAKRFGYLKAEQSNQRLQQLIAVMAGSGSDAIRDPDMSIYFNQSDLYRRLSWVYSAVTRVAESVASLAEFSVCELKAEKKTAIINHPFEQLLRRPNAFQFDSQFEFFEAIAGYLKLAGNCYLWMNALAPTLPPAEMWLLRPDRVAIVPSRDKFIQGYIYEIDEAKVAFDADEIVHLKLFHPLNDWYGLSAIESLAIAVESDYKQAIWNKNFFGKDNAKPQGALAFKEFIDDTTWAQIKEDIKKEYGEMNRRTMMIRGAGQGGVEWLQMALSQKDMEFLSGRQFSKEEIFSVLAPGLVQMIDKNATEANSVAGEKTYREYTLYPLLTRIQQKFTARTLPRYGENLIGEFADIRSRDRQIELAEIESYARRHTIDEVRAKYDGDPPLGEGRGDRIGGEAQPNATMPADSTQQTDNRQAAQAAKTLERRQFDAFKSRCLREGHPGAIAGFAFRFLDFDEQNHLLKGAQTSVTGTPFLGYP